MVLLLDCKRQLLPSWNLCKDAGSTREVQIDFKKAKTVARAMNLRADSEQKLPTIDSAADASVVGDGWIFLVWIL